MKNRKRPAAISIAALLAGMALAASSAPADDPTPGWNAYLSDEDIALSLAACEEFGEAAASVSWCADAAEAATKDEDIGELADAATVSGDDEIAVTLPDENTTLITSVPGE